MAEKGTLLVTGGAGYIGSHTVRHLLEMGEKIVVLDNLVFGHPEALPSDRVSLVEGDMSDAALLDRLFAEHKPEAVLHFAAFAYVGESVTDPLKYYRNNLAAPWCCWRRCNGMAVGVSFFFHLCDLRESGEDTHE